MTDESKSFNQTLTPEDRKQVLRALGIRDNLDNPNSEGWVTLRDHPTFNSDVSVNLKTGTVTDHYYNGHKHGSSDLVSFVGYLVFSDLIGSDVTRSIDWIKNCINGSTLKYPEYQKKAKDVIGKKLDKYAQVPNNVWKNPKLSSSAVRVWIAIQERCGKGKHCSWAGYNKLAEDTGLARNTIVDAIKQLIEEGYLVELDRGKGLAPKRYPMCNFKDYTNN